jgi:hypothetical protein
MRKTGFILFLGVAVAATNQIVIQPLVRAGRQHSAPQAGRKAKLPFATPKASDSEPRFYAPVSGYVSDPGGRGVRPILGFRVYSSIGSKVDFGEDLRTIVSSPNQNYIVEVDGAGMASLWTPDGEELLQSIFPLDAGQTTAVYPSPLGFGLAIVSNDRSLVQLFKSAPDSPSATASISFDELRGTPNQLAVTDDGGALLYTISEVGRDVVYQWRPGDGARVVYQAPSIASVAFAPYSADAVVTEGLGQQVTLLRNRDGVYSSALLVGAGGGLVKPVAAEFSRDGQQIAVADADAGVVQLYRADGALIGSATCECEPRLLRRMTGNAVFRLTEFDGTRIDVFDGDSSPAIAVTATAGPTPDPEAPPPGDASPAFSLHPHATVGVAVNSATLPANTCVQPLPSPFFVVNGSVYPWVTVTNLAATDALSVRIQDSGQRFVGPSAAVPLTRASTATSSCFYATSPVPLSGIGAGTFTMIFYLNGNQTATAVFTAVQPTANVVAAGATRQQLPNANQQNAVATIPTALPDTTIIAITPSFSANGVQNSIAGSAYDCRLTSPVSAVTSTSVSIPISAGQTQSAQFTASAGTVAGTCTIGVSSITAGSGAAPLTIGSGAAGFSSAALNMANAADAPFLNQPSITSAPGSGTLTIQVTGWSTTRDLTNLVFAFTPKSGFSLTSSALTVDVSSASRTWYTDPRSAATGGSFLYTANFTISGGTSSALGSVSVTAGSSRGTTTSAQVSIP